MYVVRVITLSFLLIIITIRSFPACTTKKKRTYSPICVFFIQSLISQEKDLTTLVQSSSYASV